jgi:hypothetical protein
MASYFFIIIIWRFNIPAAYLSLTTQNFYMGVGQNCGYVTQYPDFAVAFIMMHTTIATFTTATNFHACIT